MFYTFSWKVNIDQYGKCDFATIMTLQLLVYNIKNICKIKNID